MLYLAAGVGGAIGAYAPVLWGEADPFSGWSLLCGFLGTIVGIVVGYKLGKAIEG